MRPLRLASSALSTWILAHTSRWARVGSICLVTEYGPHAKGIDYARYSHGRDRHHATQNCPSTQRDVYGSFQRIRAIQSLRSLIGSRVFPRYDPINGPREIPGLRGPLIDISLPKGDCMTNPILCNLIVACRLKAQSLEHLTKDVPQPVGHGR
jgi:hypothetical protein